MGYGKQKLSVSKPHPLSPFLGEETSLMNALGQCCTNMSKPGVEGREKERLRSRLGPQVQDDRWRADFSPAKNRLIFPALDFYRKVLQLCTTPSEKSCGTSKVKPSQGYRGGTLGRHVAGWAAEPALLPGSASRWPRGKSGGEGSRVSPALTSFSSRVLRKR